MWCHQFISILDARRAYRGCLTAVVYISPRGRRRSERGHIRWLPPHATSKPDVWWIAPHKKIPLLQWSVALPNRVRRLRVHSPVVKILTGNSEWPLDVFAETTERKFHNDLAPEMLGVVAAEDCSDSSSSASNYIRTRKGCFSQGKGAGYDEFHSSWPLTVRRKTRTAVGFHIS